jgi:uncharacterized membrane protein YedE/YeeE
MQQDWIFGALGGLLIGVSASMYLLINGRIMGASGILGGLIDGTGRDTTKERLGFILGLIVAPLILTLLWVRPDIHITDNVAVLVAAGLFVGIGSRMANGCTSGHGVCGISRLSVRGITATFAYLLAGGVFMVVFRHMFGLI